MMEILAYLPAQGIFVHVAEGTGDNLLPEDEEAGYVDYYMWTTYAATIYGSPEFKEVDGGQELLRCMCAEAFPADDAELMLRDCLNNCLGLPDALYIIVKTYD